MDSAGNVYSGTDSGQGLLKSTYSNGAYSTVVVAAAGEYIFAVAIDSSGNIYAADEDNGSILKVVPNANGTYTTTTIITGLGTTSGVGVDGYGNIYTNNYGNTLYKYTLSGSTYTQHVIASNFDLTRGLAVDASGVIYQTDEDSNEVRIFKPNGAVATTTSYTEATPIPASATAGVAVKNGIIYIGANSQLLQETPNSSGGYTQTILNSTFGELRGIAPDNSGNIFVSDLDASLYKVANALPDFGSVTVGTSSSQQSISFVIDTAGTLGTTGVVTQGISGQDFSLGIGSTCTGASTGDCVINVIFTPKYPGERYGAVKLTNSSGAVIATALIQGNGTGPLATLTPGTLSTIAGAGAGGVSLSNNQGIVVDPAGAIYIADASNSRVLKLSGGSATAYGGSFSTPVGLALDGAGNLYVSEYFASDLKVVFPSTPTLSTVVATGLGNPNSITVDGSGNIYAAEYGANIVVRITPAGVITTLAGTGTAGYNGDSVQATAAQLNQPLGVGVDGSGNLYIEDTSNNRIRKVTASSGVITTLAGTGSGGFSGDGGLATAAELQKPRGQIVIDAGGDILFADFANNRIRKITAATGLISTVAGTGTAGFSGDGGAATSAGLSAVLGLAMDGAGNLYLGDDGNSRVREITASANPLAFAETAVGSTSTDSPQTLTLNNIGNIALTFPIPTAGKDPSVPTNFSLANSSTCPQLTSSSSSAGTLAAGATCTALVSFAPTVAGTNSSHLSFTDNTLDVSPSTQTVTLTGTGDPETPVVTVTSLAVQADSTATLTATVSYGGIAPTGVVTFAVDGTAVTPICASVSFTETCTASFPTATLTTTTHAITVSLAADANYNTASNTGTLTVVPSSYVAPSTNIAATSATQTATLIFSSATTLNGTLGTAVQVVTQGVTGADFAFVSGGTCTAGASYTAGQSCTVQYSFTPTTPGLRQGAVLLYNNASTPVLAASTYLSGTGTGPLAESAGNAPVAVTSSIPGVTGLAIDPAGDLFYTANIGSGYAGQLTAGGTTVRYPVIYGPIALTLDGAGNLYYVSSSSAGLKYIQVVARGATTVTRTIPFTQTGQIQGASLAVDGAGNVYLPGPAGVIALNAAQNYAATTLASSLTINAVTLGSDGNLYAVTSGSGNSPNSLFQITPSGTTTLLSSTGVYNADGIALDAAGDIYVANQGNDTIVRFAAGTYAQTVLSSTFRPGNLAFDAAGNLYVAEIDYGTILKFPRSAGSTLSFPSAGVGTSTPAQAATLENDGNASLTFSSLASSSSNFQLDAASTSCSTSSALLSSTSCTIGAIFAPQAAGSPLTGTVNIADNSLRGTQTISLTGSALAGTPVLAVSSLSALANGSATLSATISGGGAIPTGAVTFTVGSGASVTATCTAGTGAEVCTASYPVTGLSLGSNTITATFAGDTNYVAASSTTGTLTLVATGFSTPATSVAASSGIQTATVVFTSAGTLSAINVLTQGAPNLDYQLATGGTCAVGTTYTVGQSCTVDYTFTPSIPRLRLGGISLVTGTGSTLASTYLTGTGNGPQAVIYPGVQYDAINSTLSDALGIAIDGSGNLFVSDFAGHTVYKETPSGRTFVQSTLGSGFSSPAGIAIDGLGNVFIADSGNSQIVEEALNPATNTYTQTVLFTGTANGLATPMAIAVDSTGDLYIGNGSTLLLETVSGTTYTQSVLAGSFGNITALAVDGSGNVFVADGGVGTLFEETNASGTYTQSTAVTGLSNLSGVTLDGAGTLYLVANGTSNQILRYSPKGSGSFVAAASIGNFGQPNGVAIDKNGNLYVTGDPANGAGVVGGEVDVLDPQTLTFSAAAVGSTSTAQTVSVNNIGNGSLSFSGLASTSSSFTLDAATTTCSTGTSLASAGACTVGAAFTPQTTGTLTGGINLTDNNLNVAGTVQPLLLTGTGNPTTVSFTVAGAQALYGATTTTLSATGTFIAGITPTGAFTFTVGTGSPVVATCTATGTTTAVCTAAYPTAALPAGSYTITGALAADTNYNSSSATNTLAITQATPSLTVNSTTAAFTSETTTLTVAVAYVGTSAPTGTVTVKVGNGPLVTATCTGTASPLTCTATYSLSTVSIGANTITASLAADANYNATSSTGTLTVSTASSTVTPASASVVYGVATTSLTASVAYTGTTAPTGAFTFTVGTGAPVTAACTGSSSPLSCTATYPTVSLTPNTYAIQGSLAADTRYGAASGSGTLTVTKAAPSLNVANTTLNYGATSTTLTASLAYTGSSAPAGALTFVIDNGTAVTATCTGTTSPRTCTATYPTSSLTAGTHTVKASLAADSNYNTASASATLTVNAIAATVAVANPTLNFGASTATLSATIAFGGTLPPTGSVLFALDGGTPVLGSCTGTASPLTCTATLSVSALTAGTHTITVSLAADTNYSAATGTGTLTLSSVNPTITFTVPNHTYGDAAFTATATSNGTGAFTYTVISGPATVAGSAVTITGVGTVVLQATEAADSNYISSSKTATFTVAQAPLTLTATNATRVYGAANPTFTGAVTGAKYSDTFTESFTTTATAASPVGTYAVVPSATGTDLTDYTLTAANGTLTITQAPTTTTLVSSATAVNPNANVTFSVTVASTTTGTPTGSVTFFDNGTALGTVALANGVASYSTATLSAGTTHSITATYTGDTDFLPSATSLGTGVTVGALDFTFNTVGATAYTAAPGATATYGFAISPDFVNYAGTVNFTVTGLPTGATATFSPATLAATGGAQNITLSVLTPNNASTATTAANKQPPLDRRLPLLALLLLPALGSRKLRRKLSTRMLTLLLLLGGLGAAAALTGCGTGSTGFFSQQPATYTLTVTATSGTLQHSQTVTLTVQ